MKNYEKPVLSLVENIGEGVYMASGETGVSTDCWTYGVRSVQSWSGSHNVFEVSAAHSTAVEHISSKVVYTIVFSAPLTDAYSEFEGTTWSGNTVTVVRELHANAYKSGDSVTFKVWAKAADQASTEALTGYVQKVECTHTTNVQGKLD